MMKNNNVGYDFYINDFRLPVTPDKLTTKVKGKNKTIDLVSGLEMNFLNPAGLTSFELDALLPIRDGYSFAYYPDGFRPPDWYLLKFSEIVNSQKPCLLTVKRSRYKIASANGGYKPALFDQQIRVSIEDYTIKEDASEGSDFIVTLKFKQAPEYGTKIVRILNDGKTISIENSRETDNAPKADTYTVKEGDSLWSISKYFTGDGARYTELKEANALTNITVVEGQVLKIPW